MLHVDPAKRISAHMVLQHPWLRMNIPHTVNESRQNPPSHVARVKNVVEQTFNALNHGPDVGLAPVTQSSLAKRRKNTGPPPMLPRSVSCRGKRRVDLTL